MLPPYNLQVLGLLKFVNIYSQTNLAHYLVNSQIILYTDARKIWITFEQGPHEFSKNYNSPGLRKSDHVDNAIHAKYNVRWLTPLFSLS